MVRSCHSTCSARKALSCTPSRKRSAISFVAPRTSSGNSRSTSPTVPKSRITVSCPSANRHPAVDASSWSGISASNVNGYPGKRTRMLCDFIPSPSCRSSVQRPRDTTTSCENPSPSRDTTQYIVQILSRTPYVCKEKGTPQHFELARLSGPRSTVKTPTDCGHPQSPTGEASARQDPPPERADRRSSRAGHHGQDSLCSAP